MLTKENVIKKIEKRKDVFYLDKKSFFFPTWRTYENKNNISFGIVFDNDLIIIFTYLFNDIVSTISFKMNDLIEDDFKIYPKALHLKNFSFKFEF